MTASHAQTVPAGPSPRAARRPPSILRTAAVRFVSALFVVFCFLPASASAQLAAPYGIDATDGVFTDRIRVYYTYPDQTAVCGSVGYELVQGGVPTGLIQNPPSGTSGVWGFDLMDYQGYVPGVTYTFSVRAVGCSMIQYSGGTDTGFVGFNAPYSPSNISATDGTLPDRVRVFYDAPDQSGRCLAGYMYYLLYRSDYPTTAILIEPRPLTGGTGFYIDDTVLNIGEVYTYRVEAVCNLGLKRTFGFNSDTGFAGFLPPLAPTNVVATDGTLPDRVRVTYDFPDQTGRCGPGDLFYVLYRDGNQPYMDITRPMTGGSGSFDDTGGTAGTTYNYRVEAYCATAGGGRTMSVIDTGFWGYGTPIAPTISASDAVFNDRIRIDMTYPDQSSLCTSVDYVIRRDGAVVHTFTGPVSGGTGFWDDMLPSGTYNYWVTAVCTPGGITAASSADPGSVKASNPVAPTPAASDGTFSDRVQVTFTAPDNSSACTSGNVDYTVYRDATPVGFLSSGLTGGALSYDDFGAAIGATYNYSVEARCQSFPTRVAQGATDPGYRNSGTPLAASSITATDGSYADRVELVISYPDQSLYCASAGYQIRRDGTLITTIAGTLTGGTGAYNDYSAVVGQQHTYSVTTYCGPGGQTTAGPSDTGFRQSTPLAATAVSATDGSFVDRVRVSFTAPDQSGRCTSITYLLMRDGITIAASTSSVPLAGGPASLDDTTPTGVHSYHVKAVCNPGASEADSGADTGFAGCSPMTLSGPQGTGSGSATVSWTPSAGHSGYVLRRSSAPGGPYSDVATLDSATTSYTVGGWPQFYYTVTCVATAGMDSTSPPLRIWTNPVPIVMPRTFTAPNPGTTSITPIITDPDGNITFTLAVATPPANGTVVIVANKFEYTPNLGFLGDDPFQISATDPQGGVGVGDFIAQVTLLTPGPVNNLQATDGTRSTDVRVTWQAATNAAEYDVYFNTTASATGATLIATLPSTDLMFDHTAAVPAELRYYSVIARNGTAPGPRSAWDAGVRNTPPVGLSASGTTTYSTLINLTPVVTDPDPGEVLVFSIDTPPVNGTASVVAGKFRYVPNGTFIGQDTFAIRATDRAGEVVTGTATVDVGCSDHLVSSLAIARTPTFVNSGYRAALTYSTQGCPATLTATVKVLDGATELSTQTLSALPSGENQPIQLDMVAPATVGTYTVEFRIKNDVTNFEVVRTANLAVQAFQMPAFSWSDATAVATIEKVTLSMGTSSQCTMTLDDTAARADTTLCLVEVSGLPPEIVLQSGMPSPSWAGIPATPSVYPVVASVRQYDSAGTARTLGSTNLPLTVFPAADVVYQSPANLSVKQAIESYRVTPIQVSGPACPLYESVAAAAAAATKGRACMMTWSSTDPTFIADGKALTGALFGTPPATVTWTLNIVRPDQTTLVLGSGSTFVTVLPVSLAFNLVVTPTLPTALVSNVTIGVQQTGADTCSSLTSNSANAAIAPSRPCVFEFGTVSGMKVDTTNQLPVFKGKLPSSPITTIPYTVSIYFNGTKYPVMTGQQDIATVLPDPPVVGFEFVRQIAPDVFAVSVIGGSIGVVSTDTSKGDVTGDYQVETEDVKPFALFGSKRRSVIAAGAAPLYSSRQMTVNMKYSLLPSISTSKTVTVVSVPRDGLRLTLGAPATAPDTAPLTVSATIQESTATGPAYIAANAGQWMVEFGEINLNGVFIPMSSLVATDSSGTATASLDPAGKSFIRLAARATPISGSTGYTTTLTSRAQVVGIVKGTPVEGTITSLGPLAGPAPYLNVLRVQFATRADQIANQSITWYQSEDGGTTWNEVTAGAVGVQYASRFGVGDHMVRVRFININTSEESFSPPLTISAYPVPRITLTGNTYLLPGTPGEMNASAVDAFGGPMPSIVWSWELQRVVAGAAPVVITSGTSLPIPLDPTDAGTYRLVVKARDPSTVATDIRAWGQAVVRIVAGLPTKPAVRILGSLRLEVGQTGSYTASVSPPFDIASTNLTLSGEWTLPDGSTVSGSTLDWIPSTADYAVSKMPTLTYTAWVVGYEAETRQSATIRPTLWMYIWPTWKITKSVGSAYAPAGVQFVVMPTDITLLSVLEGLTYEWTVPSSIRSTSTPTTKFTGIVDYGGTHDVQVMVRDTRGNTQLLSESVVVGDAPPLVVDFTAVNMNKWTHAPMTLGVTTRVTGGHPLDGVSTWEYYVNGALQSLPNQSSARLSLDTPGSYDVEVRVATRMGATGTKTATVVVPANQPPVCSLTGTVALNKRSVALKANCTDSDGTLVNYKWWVNGTPVTLSVAGSWTYYVPTGQDLPALIEFTVTDNGGLTTNGGQLFN